MTTGTDPQNPHVLVVDDDRAVRDSLRRSLEFNGYAVSLASDGAEALATIAGRPPDALVIDVMMPRLDGIETTRALRSAGNDLPILVLTARDSVGDRVEGLDAGADDYLTKPFDFVELLARVRALVRRGAVERPAVIRVGELLLDPSTHDVSRAGEPIDLTTKEFALLELFMRHPDEVLTRPWLLEHAWDFAYDGGSNVVDVYVRYLREKIDRPFGRTSLRTVRGAGYRLADEGNARGG